MTENDTWSRRPARPWTAVVGRSLVGDLESDEPLQAASRAAPQAPAFAFARGSDRQSTGAMIRSSLIS